MTVDSFYSILKIRSSRLQRNISY